MVRANCTDCKTSGCFEVLVKHTEKEKRKKTQQYHTNDKAFIPPHAVAWKHDRASASLGLTSPSPSRLSEMDRPPKLKDPPPCGHLRPLLWDGGGGADAEKDGSLSQALSDWIKCHLTILSSRNKSRSLVLYWTNAPSSASPSSLGFSSASRKM